MTQYTVKYYFNRKKLPSSYIEETIKARGIMHCFKLAKDHIKVFGFGWIITDIKEITENA